MPVMLLAAVILFGSLQSICLKKYQRESNAGLAASLWAVLVLGVVMAVVMALYAGGSLSIALPTVLCALAFACCGLVSNLCFVRGVALGRLSAMNVFLMLGGIALPFVYGVTLLGEALTAAKLMGLTLIALSILSRPLLQKRGAPGAKVDRSYFLLCMGCFLLNGVCSTLIKFHGQFEGRASDASFLFFAGLFYALIALPLIVLLTRRAHPGQCLTPRHLFEGAVKRFTRRALAISLGAAALYALCNILTNLCAMALTALMDSSVQFPVQNSGIIALTTLLSYAFFREKPDKIDLVGMALAIGAIIAIVA